MAPGARNLSPVLTSTYNRKFPKFVLDPRVRSWYNRPMKYAIRHIGSSDFLSGFEGQHAEPVWVEGWDHADMLLYPTREDAQEDQEMIKAEGLHSEIEEIS